MIKEKRRECTVKITSYQADAGGEVQIMETESKGQLSERNGVLYVFYEENPEGTEGKGKGETVKNLLEIEEGPFRVSLKKSGAVSWKMTFRQGNTDESEYETPYGILKIGAETKDVKVQRNEEKTSLQLAYALFIQGQKQADCRLEIEIR